MVIVAGHITVEPAERAAYLQGCRAVVRSARGAAGCLDFTVSADLLDPARINIYERWDSRSAVEAFRGTGPDDGQSAMIRTAAVSEYDIAAVRTLA